MRTLTAQEILEAARKALYLSMRNSQSGGEVGFGALYRSLRGSQATPEVAFGNLYKYLGLRQEVIEVAYRIQGVIYTRGVAFEASGGGIVTSGVSVETGSGISVYGGGGYA